MRIIKIPNAFLSLFAVSLLFFSCGDDSQTLLDNLSKDKVISAADCAEIERESVSNKSLVALLDADGKADTAKIAAYVKSKCRRVVSFSLENGTKNGNQPLNEVQTGPLSMRPVYNVFIENSGSMDGFVNGETGFKSSIFSLLTDLKIKHIAENDELNLHYINSKPIPFTASVEDFIKRLNPASFKVRGGNRSNSDINSILDTVLTKCTPNSVSLFVSDCLLSLKGKNVNDFLTSQKTGLRGDFAAKVEQMPDFSTLIIELKSPFFGNFYRYNDAVEVLKGEERPYFLWIMGRYDYLQQLMTTLNLNKSLDGQIQNTYFISNAMGNHLAHRVVMTNKIGSFLPDKTDPMHILTKAEAASREPTKGVFQFMVAVDFQTLAAGLGDNFLTDPKNYEVSTPNYTLSIRKIEETEKQTNNVLSKYSHGLVLTTSKLHSQKIKIKLKKRLPQWVEAASWTPTNGAAEELKKTFGLSYILGGVLEAYNSNGDADDDFFTINVEVKQ